MAFSHELMQDHDGKVHVKFLLTCNDDETDMHEIKEWGMVGEGYEFDLEAWDESKHTLWATIVTYTPELSFLTMIGHKQECLLKIMD